MEQSRPLRALYIGDGALSLPGTFGTHYGQWGRSGLSREPHETQDASDASHAESPQQSKAVPSRASSSFNRSARSTSQAFTSHDISSRDRSPSTPSRSLGSRLFTCAIVRAVARRRNPTGMGSSPSPSPSTIRDPGGIDPMRLVNNSLDLVKFTIKSELARSGVRSDESYDSLRGGRRFRIRLRS